MSNEEKDANVLKAFSELRVPINLGKFTIEHDCFGLQYVT
jgi:hypothetical protein